MLAINVEGDSELKQGNGGGRCGGGQSDDSSERQKLKDVSDLNSER